MSETPSKKTIELPARLSTALQAHVGEYITHCVDVVKDKARKSELDAFRVKFLKNISSQINQIDSEEGRQETWRTFFTEWERMFSAALQSNTAYSSLSKPKDQVAVQGDMQRLPYLFTRILDEDMPYVQDENEPVADVSTDELQTDFLRNQNDPRLSSDYYEACRNVAINLKNAIPKLPKNKRKEYVSTCLQNVYELIFNACNKAEEKNSMAATAVRQISIFYLSYIPDADTVKQPIVEQSTIRAAVHDILSTNTVVSEAAQRIVMSPDEFLQDAHIRQLCTLPDGTINIEIVKKIVAMVEKQWSSKYLVFYYFT